MFDHVETHSALLDPRRPTATTTDTLADRVFEWLADQIVSGKLRPGQWVSENEVAALLGVSRSPVRDAFRGFAREGLVEVRRRRGTIIAELNAQDADDLYRARSLVESEMARLAVTEMSDADVEALAAVVENMRRTETAPEVYECTRQLWQLLIDLCPNGAIREIVAMLWRRSIRIRGIGLSLPFARADLLEFFEQFLLRAEARDAEGAGQLMAEQQEKVRLEHLGQIFIDIGEGGLMPRGVTQTSRPDARTRTAQDLPEQVLPDERPPES